MKKLLLTLSMVSIVAGLQAGEFALVYKDEQSIKDGKPWIGTPVPDGILITAEQALAANAKPWVGFMNGELRAGQLLRLDNQINVALITPGKVVQQQELLVAHQKNVENVKKNIPSIATAATSASAYGLMSRADEIFVIKINGKEKSENPIVLKVKRKQSVMDFEVVNVSTSPVWRVDVSLRADPKLSFFKKGAQQTLNDVPRQVFDYYYQSMFNMLKPQESFKVPVEIFHINEENYQFSVSIKSKIGLVIKTIPIRFEK